MLEGPMAPDPGSSAVPPVALCLGGWDASGGAGLVRDLLTVASFGLHPMAIATAETLQNGEQCSEVGPPATPPALHVRNLRPHLAGGPWGVKVGLLALTDSWLLDLLEALEALEPVARIWDPVRGPSVGEAVHDARAYRRLAERLLRPGGWVVAPNRLEAAFLAGLPLASPPGALAAPWLAFGAEAVWLKGGHAAADSVEDFWITRGETQTLGASPRLAGERRGTGCAVASAWLACRLLGQGAEDAARSAASWLRGQWPSGFRPGGVGRPVLPPGRV